MHYLEYSVHYLEYSALFRVILSAGLDLVFYLKVLFPTMTSYLTQHAGYFMPFSGQRGHSFASSEEKLIILK